MTRNSSRFSYREKYSVRYRYEHFREIKAWQTAKTICDVCGYNVIGESTATENSSFV